MHEQNKNHVGLNNEEVIQKRKIFGLNEIQSKEKQNIFNIVLKVAREPMIILLIVAAILYLVLGDIFEGLMLSASMIFVILITLYQENKAADALAKLKDLASPRAITIRNGEELNIASTELVPGDLIILQEGARIPADAILIESSNISVDESLLTGESLPVKKSISTAETEAQNSAKVFSSSLCITGHGIARVEKTGIYTEVGRIGSQLEQPVPETLNIAREVRMYVKFFGWAGLLVSVAVVFLFSISRDDWIHGLLAGLATQMALLPEEFPVVLTIFLALGGWRLSKLNVLIRNPTSIERLGSITVLCVDKTGTLTENKMKIAALHNGTSEFHVASTSESDLPESFHQLAEYALLASHTNPFDPMEQAIKGFIVRNEWGAPHFHEKWILVEEYPLSPELLAMSCVWKDPIGENLVVAAKGAPESVIDLCHLGLKVQNEILAEVRKMASQGLRVLGVARATLATSILPTQQHDFNFSWVGLVGLADPLRKEVSNSVELCRQAGIRIIMMTGDYPETALRIAQLAGLGDSGTVIQGPELRLLSDDELRVRLKTTNVFARMVPDGKLRIVKILRESGEVVGMTGDGVNDAPSLKWADVGIAMGSRGTDVAREASDIVLMDDNFSSIVDGIKRGRMIYANIRKALNYIIAIHVPIAGLSILPLIFNKPLLLFPIHIVIMELIIDPACSLLFERQQDLEDVMTNPPRAVNSRMFKGWDILRSILQGGLIMMVAMSVYYIQSDSEDSENKARTLTYLMLVWGNIALIFADLGMGNAQSIKFYIKRKSTWFILLGATVFSVAITQFQFLRQIFHFTHLTSVEFMIPLLGSTFIFLIVSIWNRIATNRARI